MSIETKLCVEIKTILGNGDPWYGSGYQIAGDLILTAAHVVFGDSEENIVNQSEPIFINWRGEDDSEKIKETELSFSENAVVWSCTKPGVDLAVLRFKVSDGPQHKIPPLASILQIGSLPTSGKWFSAGFSAQADDPQGNRSLEDPSGTLPNIKRQDPKMLSLSSGNQGMNEASAWGGCSGGPVFIGDRLCGVLCCTKTKQNNGFWVSLLNPVLEDVDDDTEGLALREALGLASDFRRQAAWQRVRKNIVECLKNEPLKNTIAEELRQEIVDFSSSTSVGEMADVLCKSGDDVAVTVFSGSVWDSRVKDNREALQTLDCLARWWLSFWGGGDEQAPVLVHSKSTNKNGIIEFSVSDPDYGCLQIEGVVSSLEDREPVFSVNAEEIQPVLDWSVPDLLGLDENLDEAKKVLDLDAMSQMCPSIDGMHDVMQQWYEKKEKKKISEKLESNEIRFLIGKHLSRRIKVLKGRPYIRVEPCDQWLETESYYPDLTIVQTKYAENTSHMDLVRTLQTLIVDIHKQLAQLQKSK